MAIDSGYDRPSKRRKRNLAKKLLIGEQVEVLYCDEGLKGSWHTGTVIACGECTRLIEYTNLLSDDNSSKLQESIHVSSSIEGLPQKTQENHRNNIRPLPPHYETLESEVKYGLCVDAYVNDAWWEGVVFDRAEGAKERLIFFPDEGDEQIICLDQLRLTQIWNELSGHWKPRGEWLMIQVLQPFEQDQEDLPVSVREIWYDLRVSDEFSEKIGVWTFGSRSTWHVLVSDLIRELRSVVLGVIPYKQFIEFKGSKMPVEKHCGSIIKTNVSCKMPDSKESWKTLDLEAACYPEAVKICAAENGGTKDMMVSDDNFYGVRLKAKKHLAALGWKIESRLTKTHLRVRFISPEGKCYDSLHRACCALLNGHQNRKQSLSPETCEFVSAKVHHNSADLKNSQSSSKMVDCDMIEELPPNVFPVRDDLEPENNPEAVLEYKSCFDLFRNKGKDGFPNDLDIVRLNARKHLKFMGWKFWIKGQHKKELFITSPNGKPFPSLYSACNEFLREENLKNTSVGRLKLVNLSDLSESQELGTSNMAVERNTKSKQMKIVSQFSCICNNTQESKRPQQNAVHTLSQSVPRTVLSLLIDNDMVAPMQKVRYIRKRDGQVLMEGHITRDGIKCMCCGIVYTLSNFEAHAGSTYRRPAASIFLEDGRSLLQCKREIVYCKKPKDFRRLRVKGDCSRYKSDVICSVCHEGGSLLLCDHCPSAFHISCVGLENAPEGKWFCPSCRCGICGLSEFNSDTQQFTEKTILYCDQCEREYHVGCMEKRANKSLSSCPVGNWFCSKYCSKIFHHLRQLIGKSNITAVEGLSWTILRSSRENGVDNLQFDAATMTEHDSKLCVALDVLHKCFTNIIEPRTQSDLVADLLFNKESELRRLNFYGFYTVLLKKGDELISVAAFRVYGDKVAEMPLVATCVKYQRQGMCRLLVNELEKLLSELGVENLVLPALPQLQEAWTSSFGFSKMNSSDRLKILEYTFLNFQDTTMCHKLIRKDPTVPAKPKGDCKELMNISCRSIKIADSQPCVDGNHFEQIGSQTEAEHSPASACINSLRNTEPKARVNGLETVSPHKCMDSNAAADASPIITLEAPPNLKFTLSAKNVNNGLVSSFKHFYKRRISANN